MLTGYIDKIAPELIGGWAADTDEPDAVVDVVIYIDGIRAGRIAADRPRADLRELKIYGGGNHGFRLEFATPLPLHLIERVSVRFARTGAMLTDGNKSFNPDNALSPILVTSPARSGTTLLMSRLARCPTVCVAETPPYEVRLLSYWSTVCHTLTAEANFDRSTHPDRLEGNGFLVGSNPFCHPSFLRVFRSKELAEEYFAGYAPQMLQDTARKLILEYYGRLRDDQRKPQAETFAEKNNNLDNQPREFARMLFPNLREIVLIRDPRDLVCSYISYFGQNEDRAIRDVTEACQELMRIKRNPSPNTVFISYEKLMSGEGIAPLTADERAEASLFAVHATSSSPQSSVGRWRTDLEPRLAEQCTETWAEFLSEFGYSQELSGVRRSS